jgi:predicted ATP-dependent endonuclease of OLD family
MSKIISLQVENVKRVSAVEITPTGSTVVIGGRNGAGKTSVLDAIEMALGGGSLPDVPVHVGASKGQIICKLDDIIVTKTITPEGKTTLTVTTPDGKQRYGSPQTLLDGLVGKLTFDPLAFSRQKPREQLETLRNLVGLDLSALDRQRKALYDERALAGRDVQGRQSQIDAMPEYPEAPAQEIDVADLAAQLEAVNAHNSKQDNLGIHKKTAEQSLAACEKRQQEITQEIARLQSKLAMEREAAKTFTLMIAQAAVPVYQDAEPLRQRIKEAEATNRQVRANASRAAMVAQFATAKEQYAEYDAKIDAIDVEKQRLVREANFPIAGLGLGDEGVTFRGLPFSQCSSAEQLRISVAMGLAMNPKLKVLLIRDGSLLDSDNLQTISEMAETSGGQVWIERVGEGQECQVIIENGEVKA